MLGSIMSTIIRSPAIFVYILRHEVIDPAAIFVYILRHLFTYQRLKLGLFTPRDRLGQGQSPSLFKCDVICLHIRVES